MSENFFDVLGPVMIGPSSSHTAGAVRLGRACRGVAGLPVREVTFYLHGSFAKTYRGHGTDRALTGGLLGMETDDERLIHSPELAAQKGIRVRFLPADLGDVHPNTIRAVMVTEDLETHTLMGSSIGGGNIRLMEINGFSVDISGEYETLIVKHLDQVGMISKIAEVLEQEKINIVSMANSREKKGGIATTVIEIDQQDAGDLCGQVSKLPGILSAVRLSRI
jgi:L-serine dehydratase